MEQMTMAIVDIGSNSIRMNLYRIEGDNYSLAFTTKASAGLVSYIHHKRMSQEGIDKLSAVLKEFMQLDEILQADAVFLFATASLRKIDNASQVVDEIHQETGLYIELLSGQQEAAYSWQGASKSLFHERGLYADIGGGSSELVVYSDKKITHAVSLPVGSLNLFNKYVKDIFPTQSEREKTEKKIKKEFKKSGLSKKDIKAASLSICGGSIRAIRKVLVELGWVQEDQMEFDAKLLEQLIHLLEKDRNGALHLFVKVAPDRIHTISCGLIIANTIAKLCRAKTIQVAMEGVREGYLNTKIGEMHEQ